MKKILIIGACGQLGSELTFELRKLFGHENVIASDINAPKMDLADEYFEHLDVLNKEELNNIIDKHNISEIYNLAAILSAIGEKNPKFAWKLNMEGLINTLDVAKEKNLTKIYWPSSIAVFGPDTPRKNTPQDTIMNPNTVYGISKLAGERWCEYYFQKYGVDIRSLRYPGLIGYKSLPGGGTTDYAVDIYYKAISGKNFECFLNKDTYLPMMYMADAIKATIDLMQADKEDIQIRSSYNLAAISFTPEEISNSIKKTFPDFEITYKPDFRQAIADSWPDSIDDSKAREDWGWNHEYDLDRMTEDILLNLKRR
ncbi:NAD-dependent epimerase/dehydratase family protein [Fulvivirgaceae bacterium BMA10]|uniref:NAD-dependent epimerase/dehydratase family protein n=1 Tax=Splendidivirga corallicola TaxID=3051826 RepID=A0ABT8KPZ0_9BACT|nr:NAD-dependent epimerase/dehydratase family protein [Fulvivirgaceae bacterium BMA10]